MKRSLIIVIVPLLFAAPVLAAVSESCCACLATATAQTAQKVPAGPALFCRLITSPEEQQAFGSECDVSNGDALCLASAGMSAPQDNLNCTSLFAESGIICPAGRPVPVIGSSLLLGLGGVLAAVGVWASRRRVRR
ncbi:MAG TPA: hypothetical protein VL049_02085 [Candidatus Dormibacteraeota bacterium]|nr:hypothetical protein [Candidatus Dormibacteraeota bacterium]